MDCGIMNMVRSTVILILAVYVTMKAYQDKSSNTQHRYFNRLDDALNYCSGAECRRRLFRHRCQHQCSPALYGDFVDEIREIGHLRVAAEVNVQPQARLAEIESQIRIGKCCVRLHERASGQPGTESAKRLRFAAIRGTTLYGKT